MRFGIFIPQGWRLDLAGIDTKDQWRVMRELAQAADRGPWKSLWVYDHFHTVPIATEDATHEAWSLMSAFGAVTERVRLGQMCTCMGYRNPAYLAKVAATADIVSGGRVEMGIGGGWYEHEWNAYGYGFPAPASGSACSTRACRSCATSGRSGTSTLVGKHYQVDGAICRPLPLQDGGIPLWIAGGGEKKTLRIAAKYAQYTNFDATPETFKHKSEVLAQHCKDVGTEFDAITRSSNYNVVIGDEREGRRGQVQLDRGAPQAARPGRRVRAHDEPCCASGPLVGTPEQVVEKLTAAEELGLTLRDLLLRRRRLRPQQHRVVRVAGHPRARTADPWTTSTPPLLAAWRDFVDGEAGTVHDARPQAPRRRRCGRRSAGCSTATSPLYGGPRLDQGRGRVLAGGRAGRRRLVGRRLVPVLDGRLDPRQPGRGARGRASRATRCWSAAPRTAARCPG